VSIKPLCLHEWLEQIRAKAASPEADFATEALDIVADNRTDDFYDVVSDLEKAAGQKFAETWHMVEFFTDRHHLLAEIEEQLQAAGLAGDPFKDTADIVAELLADRAETEGG